MEKRVAFVTGSAGGIGAAIARRLAEDDMAVALVDLPSLRLSQVAEVLTDKGMVVCTVPADVSDRAQVRAAVADAERRLGPIDALVNAAGVLRLGKVGELTDDDWAATFAVNAYGVFCTSQAVVERMAPRGRGAVVTVASNAAGTPRMSMAAYCASKSAATMFTKVLGLEMAEHGIRCNVVAPGSTDTPMLRSMWSGGSGPETALAGSPEAYKVGIPLRKLASAEDIADAVAFLLSDAAGHITMHSLTVDGGAALGA
ncbi:2,3-dihydro-2,3-dihydroxybenzoate dehydrogenase [Micromonospora sp. KC606]|uniref:2,3-dihydro-2,3-dihydroxybenzoate dehydrogenase n=1 Tax=Micromonospora sp. KC606 TaxID=2530379 RepID=UPI001043C093|nr:2,3-dihydro-2,3-dihydroxybenzoate dehydrogenase [Micromonospora sp. KC606]TDC84219.1 2,3-dihydro-2,3-dihydroxybenzoate dehydrogenase [Micromonospora sp. KC606]